MNVENIDLEAFEAALQIGKLMRDATGLCCAPLAELTFQAYQGLRRENVTGELYPANQESEEKEREENS